ncbi:MAG: flagellar hook-associated protein FlgK [Bdellovibrionales bacterium]|nr:flagellar hook-associated protein FlgK [Bdellovibrionales bacterium]
MALLNVLQTGKSGMSTAKAGIATSGHNIANASSEGFSRQRVQSEAAVAKQAAGQSGGHFVGEGSRIARVERINDEYLEKQLREGSRDTAFHEEKQVFLNQVEDVFNEMNGDGLNRLIARFHNDFRKLSNEPTSEAIRQSVRESSQAMIRDFKRLRGEVESIRSHIDNRIEGSVRELNTLAGELAELNRKIVQAEVQGTDAANDLRDRRDLVVKKMNSLVDITAHKDNQGNLNVDIKGVGPLVTGVVTSDYSLARHGADSTSGSVENSLQISRSSQSKNFITDHFKGGRIGAQIETRDRAVNQVLGRLDELAYAISRSVNELHEKGFTLDGKTGVRFFETPNQVLGAADRLALSGEILGNVNNIAVALQANAPSDNRNALAIANLQNHHLMNGGHSTVDDFYNSIVSEVGVASSRNKEALGQQQSIITQLNRVRDQVSGVSIDEETTNLMQFQHAFDASARVIRVADEMMDTVLKLRG